MTPKADIIATHRQLPAADGALRVRQRVHVERHLGASLVLPA